MRKPRTNRATRLIVDVTEAIRSQQVSLNDDVVVELEITVLHAKKSPVAESTIKSVRLDLRAKNETVAN